MNAVDEHYTIQALKKQQLAEWLFKVSMMEPNKRKAFLERYNMSEDDFMTSQKVQGQEVEPGPQGAESVGKTFFDTITPLTLALTAAFGWPMLYSALFGKAAGVGAGALGAGTLTQDIVELIGNMVSFGGSPEEEAKLLAKIGPEALDELRAVQHGEQNVEILKKIKAGIESGEFKPGELSIKFARKLKGILKEPNDEELRLLKPGFISQETVEAIYKAQSRRINRLNKMLTVLKTSGREEADVLIPKIADEFTKYSQLATSKIKETDKAGREILRMVKHEFTDAELEDIKKFAQNDEFIPVLNRVLNKHYNPLGNQRGAIDMKLLTGIRSLLSNKGRPLMERLYRFEVDSQLMNPGIAIRKLATDLAFVPFQRLAQSAAMVRRHKSLSVGARMFVAAMHAYRESLFEAGRIAKATMEYGIPEFEHLLAKEAGSVKEAVKLGIQRHGAVYAEEAFDSTEPGMVGQYLGSYYSVGSRLVMSADQFAKVLAYRSSKYMFAMDRALEELGEKFSGLELYEKAATKTEEWMQHPPEWLQMAQIKDMYQTTFTDSSALIQKMTDFARQYPWIRIIFPYIRTPLNLYKEGLKMSPLGFLMSFTEAKGSLERGTTQAKAALSSIFTYIIWQETLKGNITGSGPANPKHYNMKLKHPYTMWGHEYQHLGPFGSYIALIADAAEAYATAHPGDKYQLSNAVFEAVGKSFTNAPTVEGVINLVNVLEQARKGKGTEVLSDLLGQVSSGFVPAPLRMAAKIEDPIYRQARGLVDRIKRTMPGYSQTLPPFRNWDATPQYIPPGVDAHNTPPTTWDILWDMLSPIPGYADNMDAYDKELADKGVEFSRPPDHIPWGNKTIPLTREQQDRWNVYAGTLKSGGMNQRQAGLHLIQQDYYKHADKDPQLNREYQKILLKANHNAYNGYAKAKIIEELTNAQTSQLPSEQLPGKEQPGYFYNIWKTPQAQVKTPQAQVGEAEGK